MAVVALALLGLLVLAVLLRGAAGLDPAGLKRAGRFAGIAILGALTLFFAVTERWIPAVFLASICWSLYTGGRAIPAGWHRQDEPPPPRRGRSAMSRAEALQVLGLSEGASAGDIRAAHKRLIMQIHPDRGGSDYLAAKINEAKEILLRD